MIVEFAGLPASGKTTLVKKLRNSADFESKKMVFPLIELYEKTWLKRNYYKILMVGRYFFLNFRKSTQFINLLFQYEQTNKVNYLRLTLNNLFLFAIQEKYKDSSDIVIFDEGAIQHLWGITLDRKKERDIVPFFKYYTFPDVIVFTDVSNECLTERNLYRGQKNNQKNEINARHRIFLSRIPEEIAQLKKIAQTVVAKRNGKGKSKIIVIANDDTASAQENVTAIKNFILTSIE